MGLYGSDGRTGGAPHIDVMIGISICSHGNAIIDPVICSCMDAVIIPVICSCMNAIFCTGRTDLPSPGRKSLKAHGSGFFPAGIPFPCGLPVGFPAPVICLYRVTHK